MRRVWNSRPEDVLSFVCENDEDKVFAVINFTAEPQSVTFSDAPFAGAYTDYFSGDAIEIDAETVVDLEPWGYRVYVR